MKGTIVILSFAVTLFVAGVLLGNHLQTDEREAATLEEEYAAQFRAQMPEMVVDPMPGFYLY